MNNNIIETLKKSLRFNSNALQRPNAIHGKLALQRGSFFSRFAVVPEWIRAHKKATAATVLAATLAVGGIAATHTNDTNTAEVDPPADGYTQIVETPTSNTEDTFGLLADSLDLSGLSMNNDMLTEEEQAKKIADELGATYDGPVVTRTDANGEQQLWVSEDDIKKAEEAGIADAPVGTEKVTVDQGWIAPDGTVWLSQQEYEKFVQGNNGPATISVDDGWRDPDGVIWESEEEYNKFQASQGGTVVTPVQNGEVTELESGWRDPDGVIWESKEEYEKYINGMNNLTNGGTSNEVVPGTTSNTENQNIQKDQYGGYVQDGYYHAADGYVYDSLNDYLALQNASTNTNTSANTNENGTGSVENQNIQKDQYGGYVQDGYYHAADGYIYESVNDYLAAQNLTTATTNGISTHSYVDEDSSIVPTAYSVDEEDNKDVVVTTTPAASEEDKIEYDEYGGYVGEDGFYHAANQTTYVSLQDYLNDINYSTTTTTDGDSLYTDEATSLVTTGTGEEAVTPAASEEDKIEYDEYGGYVGKDGFYHAANGYIYETQQDYLNELLYGSSTEELGGEKTL